MKAATHPDEIRRLAALDSYEILDTPREAPFDEIVALAAKICETPVSIVNILGENGQFFKAEVGVGGRTAPLEAAICAHAILTEGFLEVPDTTQDIRFEDNPLVVGDPLIRFYAGAVLETPEKLPLGTLCVLDVKPRELTDLQKESLRVLSNQVMVQLELRKKLKQLQSEKSNTELARKEILVQREVLSQAEQALQAEQRRTERMIADARIATFEYEVKTGRVIGSGLLNQFFNVEDNAFGKVTIASLLESIHPEDKDRVTKVIREAMQLGTDYEVEYRVNNVGSRERWVLARGETELDQAGSPQRVSGIVLDISRRRTAELALRDEQAKLRDVVNTAPSFIIVLRGPEFVYEVVNEAAYRLLGQDDLVGRKFEDVLPEADSQDTLHLLSTVYNSKRAIRMKEVPFVLSRPHQEPAAPVYIDQTYQPLLNQFGEVYGIAINGFDVTERVLARRRIELVNEELEIRIEERTKDLQSSVREAEGFNYSISHDLRSPLRAINASASILLEELHETLDPEHIEILKRQAFNAKRLGMLVDDLLKLSRLARVQVTKEPFDLRLVCLDLLDEFGPTVIMDRTIDIEDELMADGDIEHVRLLVGNLLENAIKFSAPNARISIGKQEGKSPEVYFVKDNGVGFEMTYRDKIFLPFERLVREDEAPGTGIGLANVKRIVERHGGRVWAESEKGIGSTFFFTLSP